MYVYMYVHLFIKILYKCSVYKDDGDIIPGTNQDNYNINI